MTTIWDYRPEVAAAMVEGSFWSWPPGRRARRSYQEG